MKSHMHFQFVPKSMTLNGQNALLQKKICFTQPNSHRLILSAAKCRSTILVSRNIRYMRIFVAVPRGGASKDSRVVDNNSFWLIRRLLLRKLWR